MRYDYAVRSLTLIASGDGTPVLQEYPLKIFIFIFIFVFIFIFIFIFIFMITLRQTTAWHGSWIILVDVRDKRLNQ